MSSSAGKRRRTAQDPNRPAQGTAFYELVVAPTLDPANARPYTDPLTGQLYNPTSGAADQADAASGTPYIELSDEEEDKDQEGTQEPAFFIHVTKTFTDTRAMTGKRANARKVQTESKTVPRGAIQVFGYSRGSFVSLALTAHDLEDDYAAGLRGPVFTVFWSGTKTNPNTVDNDSDWSVTLDRFRKAAGANKKIDTLYVVFDLDKMEPFRTRAKRPYSPDPYASEMTFGPRVPSLEYASSHQLAVGQAAEAIKAAHHCAAHGHCFIDEASKHVSLGNHKRLNAFAEAVVDGRCVANGPPPQDLLNAWGVQSIYPVAAKPRGRNGSIYPVAAKPRGRNGPHASHQPFAAPSAESSAAAETRELLMLAVAQGLAKQAGVAAPASAQAPSTPPRRSPPPLSSPPPAVDDALQRFMAEFAKGRTFAPGVIERATTSLWDLRFTPDVLADAEVSIERICGITGMVEGDVRQMRIAARKWEKKMDAKRVRRGMD
ncbi:hypothetical protein MKEN_00844000 [Mycena kentingensis (nom. inval.)]|nr:hypothetical protein MKEN_00844000 [Mycena kentingensis (nom. inval.)]